MNPFDYRIPILPLHNAVPRLPQQQDEPLGNKNQQYNFQSGADDKIEDPLSVYSECESILDFSLRHVLA